MNLARDSARTLATTSTDAKRSAAKSLSTPYRDRRTAHRWVKAIVKRAGLGHVYRHMLRSAFIMAALDAGVPFASTKAEFAFRKVL